MAQDTGAPILPTPELKQSLPSYRRAHYGPWNYADGVVRHFKTITYNIKRSAVAGAMGEKNTLIAVYVNAPIIGGIFGWVASLASMFGITNARTGKWYPAKDAVTGSWLNSFGDYVHVALFRYKSDSPFMILATSRENQEDLLDRVTRAMNHLNGKTITVKPREKNHVGITKEAMRKYKLHVRD